jgi:toxin ParE1/3/4
VAGFRLTRLARRDLSEIGRYTAGHWGLAQRDRYLTSIFAEFQRLADSASASVSADHLVPGYRRGRHGRHYIFFRQVHDQIEIVRVLHDRMDLVRHLREMDGG